MHICLRIRRLRLPCGTLGMADGLCRAILLCRNATTACFRREWHQPCAQFFFFFARRRRRLIGAAISDCPITTSLLARAARPCAAPASSSRSSTFPVSSPPTSPTMASMFHNITDGWFHESEVMWPGASRRCISCCMPRALCMHWQHMPALLSCAPLTHAHIPTHAPCRPAHVP